MHQRIEAIKSNEEIGVKFMQEWEEKILDRRKAREEGHAEGIAEGEALVKKVFKFSMQGQSNEKIAELCNIPLVKVNEILE